MSLATLRWWYRAGKLDGARNHSPAHAPEIRRRLSLPVHPERAGHALFAGVVRSVELDGMMALVEIEAGPFLLSAAVTRDTIDEIGLVEGSPATATVRATSVIFGTGPAGVRRA